jgi:hypothetical protein
MIGSGAPPDSVAYYATISSYDNKAPTQIGEYKLLADSPTFDVYIRQNDKSILFVPRGTLLTSADDIKADASLAVNQLTNSRRYKTDKALFQHIASKFPPSLGFEYYYAGHSLGNAIGQQLKREFPFIKAGISFNGAFQPSDLVRQDPTIKRLYTDKDFLYKLGGKFFKNVQVIPSDKQQSTGFFSMLRSKLTPDVLSAHSLSNFKKLYDRPQENKGVVSDQTEPTITSQEELGQIEMEGEGKSGLTLQSVVVKNSVPMRKARQMAEKIADRKLGKVDKTEETFRFRVVSPKKFSRFVSKIVNDDITLVFGADTEMKGGFMTRGIPQKSTRRSRELKKTQAEAFKTGVSATSKILAKGLELAGMKGASTIASAVGSLADAIPSVKENPRAGVVRDVIDTITGGRKGVSQKAGFIMRQMAEIKKKHAGTYKSPTKPLASDSTMNKPVPFDYFSMPKESRAKSSFIMDRFFPRKRKYSADFIENNLNDYEKALLANKTPPPQVQFAPVREPEPTSEPAPAPAPAPEQTQSENQEERWKTYLDTLNPRQRATARQRLRYYTSGVERPAMSRENAIKLILPESSPAPEPAPEPAPAPAPAPAPIREPEFVPISAYPWYSKKYVKMVEENGKQQENRIEKLLSDLPQIDQKIERDRLETNIKIYYRNLPYAVSKYRAISEVLPRLEEDAKKREERLREYKEEKEEEKKFIDKMVKKGKSRAEALVEYFRQKG